VEFPKEAVSLKVLGSGLVVLAKECPPRELVSISVKITAGSSLEGEYLGSGISHLVEHMVFKGTKTRPAGAIEKEVKSYGGFINGSTSQDLTDYYITCQSRYFDKALSLLKDMLQNAVFDPAEFEKEKEVILKEINLRDDEPTACLVRILNETAYLEHPYKYPPIGYEAPFRRLAIASVFLKAGLRTFEIGRRSTSSSIQAPTDAARSVRAWPSGWRYAPRLRW